MNQLSSDTFSVNPGREKNLALEYNSASVNGTKVYKSNQTKQYMSPAESRTAPSSGSGFYDRGLTVLTSLIPYLNPFAAGPECKGNHSASDVHLDIDNFTTCPLMRALASYQSVPLKPLLPTIQQDFEMKTARYPEALLFTEQMIMDCREEPRGALENLMLLGSGASSTRKTYPRMQLLMEVIDLLSVEHGDKETGSVFQALFEHAQKNPGTLSHRLVSSFLSSNEARNASQPQSGNITSTTNSDNSIMIGGKLLAGVLSLGTFWSTFSTAAAGGGSHSTQNTTHNCTSTEFPCASGSCIDRTKVCDSHYDCGPSDPSDESPTECPEHCEGTERFSCKTISQCIPRQYQCDGDFDCLDGSDEISPPCPCPTGTTLCNDGSSCIDNEKLCDGHQNCPDNSDESFQHCKNKFMDKISQWREQSPDNHHRLTKACCEKGYLGQTSLEDLPDAAIEQLWLHHGVERRKCNTLKVSNYNRRDCKAQGCPDGERDISVFWCKPYRYSDGGCIQRSKLCDGKRFCRNGADEATDFCYSTCSDYQIPCGTSKCISPDQLCDGKRDCPNGRDENPYTCIHENVRIEMHKSCRFYSGNAKSNCTTTMEETCCSAVNGTAPITPAPMNTSLSSPSTLIPSNSSSSHVQNSLFIDPLSMGLGVIIGFASAGLLAIVCKLGLNAYYRSQLPIDVEMTRFSNSNNEEED